MTRDNDTTENQSYAHRGTTSFYLNYRRSICGIHLPSVKISTLSDNRNISLPITVD